MKTTMMPSGLKPPEKGAVSIGFFLAGFAIVVTGLSYLIYMKFTYQWLVWAVGAAFLAVGILTIEWPRGLRNPGEVPQGKFRQLLLLSVPLAFILSS